MTPEKEIIISEHAALSMKNRGASADEVIAAIRSAEWTDAKKSRLQAKQTIPFNRISPVNGIHYTSKTVEAVFVDEPNAITVVTVKVYYHNE